MTAQAEPIKPRTRCTWSAQERADWIELFNKSGQTAVEFCRDNDLSPTTLALWRSQHRHPAVRTDLEEAAFLEVPVSALGGSQPAAGPAVTIRLDSGTRLDIVPGTDPLWLAHLLTALRG